MEEDKFITGEEFKALKAKKTSLDNKQYNKQIIFAVAVIIYSVIIFYLGVTYQKHHVKSTASNSVKTLPGGRFGGFGGGNFANHTFGTVTAVSSTSISVLNSRTNTSTTLTINSSTQITQNQQTISASSITVGETVIVGLNSTDKSVASTISVVSLPSPTSVNGSSTTGSQVQ